MTKTKKVIGIDLGTTNSVVATVEGGKGVVIPNFEGLRTTPSVVAYTKKQELLVGQLAKRQAVINPENTFSSIKRFIGSKMEELSDSSKRLPYPISADSKGTIKITCSNLNRDFTPEEISAQVLKKLANDASTYMGGKISNAIITVPAYFNDSQRQATKDAGEIAGLEVLRIVNEPTAASLAYGLEKKEDQTILVFDLGGGTFDVSVLEVGEGVFEVLSTSGDTNLGGDDFDQKITDWIIEEFQKKEGIDLTTNPQALQRITEASEKAKIELSSLSETTISLPFILSTENDPKHIETSITRSKFNELCSNLIERCRIPVEYAVKDAELEAKDIDEVVLVGGSTRIPAIQELVRNFVGKAPNQSVNPDEVVAIGAALQGGIIVGDIKEIILLDVIPLSLGVETMGNIMTPIIPRNTTIPTQRSEIFSTAMDNQTTVQIEVLQGERTKSKDNKNLGTFRLSGIPPALRGVPQIVVTFDIDVDGILSVEAKDKVTGVQQSITIQGSSTLSKEEIDNIINQAKISEEKDKQVREDTELLNEIDNVIYSNEKIINEKPIDEKEKLDLLNLLKDIRDLRNEAGSKIGEIDPEMKLKLSQKSTELHEKLETYREQNTETTEVNSKQEKSDGPVIDI